MSRQWAETYPKGMFDEQDEIEHETLTNMNPIDRKADIVADLLGEPRLVECPACDGNRGFEHFTHYSRFDGSAQGYWEPCDACHSTGEVEIEDEPITEADDYFELGFQEE